MKKLKFFIMLAAAAMMIAGCSNQEKAPEAPKKAVVDKNAVDKSNTAKGDEEFKKEVAKEKGLSNVNLIVTQDGGGFVMLDFDVDSKMKKEDAEKIAQKYGKKLKEKYKDHNIDVQARKDGEKFVQVSLKK